MAGRRGWKTGAVAAGQPGVPGRGSHCRPTSSAARISRPLFEGRRDHIVGFAACLPRRLASFTSVEPGDWKVARTRKQECPRYVAQAFQLLCRNDLKPGALTLTL